MYIKKNNRNKWITKYIDKKMEVKILILKSFNFFLIDETGF